MKKNPLKIQILFIWSRKRFTSKRLSAQKWRHPDLAGTFCLTSRIKFDISTSDPLNIFFPKFSPNREQIKRFSFFLLNIHFYWPRTLENMGFQLTLNSLTSKNYTVFWHLKKYGVSECTGRDLGMVPIDKSNF